MALPLEIPTARLHLRRLRADDLDDLLALDADPEVMRYINGGQPNPRELYEADLLPRMLAWDDRPYGFLAAREGGRFIGWFHLRPSVAEPAILELGYRLRRDAWGRGLATEGSRALLAHAFDRLDETAVDACAHPGNAASIAVMVKCGMTHVGAFLHPRAHIEVVRYRIDRDAWRARASTHPA